MNSRNLCILIVLCSIYSSCSALECYVCSNQTDNTEKCLNTIKTCEPGEDVCLSEVRWGSTPYWSLGDQRQYYVSKRCSTKDLCKKIRAKYMPYCTRIWYEDWTCSECCLGDRCNYYVINGSSRHQMSNLLTGIVMTMMMMGLYKF
uniref:CSON008669 protein n=1 Tax=Culicoides sonorensis TaxID=179676 RepID=A0A336LFC6_CULSO